MYSINFLTFASALVSCWFRLMIHISAVVSEYGNFYVQIETNMIDSRKHKSLAMYDGNTWICCLGERSLNLPVWPVLATVAITVFVSCDQQFTKWKSCRKSNFSSRGQNFVESYESPFGFSCMEIGRVFGFSSIQFVWHIDSLWESNWILADWFGASLCESGLLDF